MALRNDIARRRSPAEGEELVTQFEHSGLGPRAFCATRSLSVNTLSYWRRKLRGSGVGRSSFVELTPVAVAASASNGWDVELELGAGVVLRVRRGA
jgi:hypothetical protein